MKTFEDSALRDSFARAALAAMNAIGPAEEVAQRAYGIAEAMMNVRNSKLEEGRSLIEAEFTLSALNSAPLPEPLPQTTPEEALDNLQEVEKLIEALAAARARQGPCSKL